MLAVLLCLLSLLMVTSVCLARPLRQSISTPACSSGRPAMPDLNGLNLRSSPRVRAMGRLIKGIYYSDTLNGPHTLAAFFIACDQLLEPKPFLVMDFPSHRFFFDRDRDSCADATGLMSRQNIDPADFYPAVDRAHEICDQDIIGQRRPNGLATLP
jgi:hypothetical protein